jgi:hypothetical protein
MNSKIIDYTVVSNHDHHGLISQVCKLLKEGYEPLDGVQVVAPVLHGDEVAPVYLQTMIRRE